MNILNQRDYKKLLVLNLILSYNGISRTEISALTDYRAATVGDLVHELLEEQIIIESGKAKTAQGRKRKMLEVNGELLCAIGVVIYPPKIDMMICSIKGDILSRISLPFEKDWPAERIIRIVNQNILSLASAFKDKRIIGVGICDPGVVAANREYSVSSVYINSWRDVQLKSMVEVETGLPVIISSRVFLTAFAEQKLGLAKGKKDFICLVLSEGIGLSFVCNGHVVNGHTGMAGQIGHTVINQHSQDTPCYCGNFGCMETTCSFPAIKKKIAAALRTGSNSSLASSCENPDLISPEDIRKAIDSGDRLAINVVKNAARSIGFSLANSINILDPEVVIMSGEMLIFGDTFTSTIIESAIEHIIPIQNTSIKFLVSELMDTALPLGAASVVFSEFMQTDLFNGIYGIA